MFKAGYKLTFRPVVINGAETGNKETGDRLLWCQASNVPDPRFFRFQLLWPVSSSATTRMKTSTTLGSKCLPPSFLM